MARREGYIAGVEDEVRKNLDCAPSPRARLQIERDAKSRYPLKVERPRVVRDAAVDTNDEFRFYGGRFERSRRGTDCWNGMGHEWIITPSVVRLFADLLEHPTEVCDAD